MCFNEPTSWITFIGISAINIASIFYIKEEKYTAIALIFQYVLLMQLFDALAWHNPDCNSKLNQFATKGAFLANVTQPIVAFLLLFLISSSPQPEKIISIVVVLFYILWVISCSTKVKLTCLKKGVGCSNLDYNWWNYLQPAFIYHFSLVLIILLLVRPFKLGFAVAGIIVATFVVSALYYRCGVSSVWCFFAAFIPLFNVIAYKKLR